MQGPYIRIFKSRRKQGSREDEGIAGRNVDAVDGRIEYDAVSIVSSKVEEES